MESVTVTHRMSMEGYVNGDNLYLDFKGAGGENRVI